MREVDWLYGRRAARAARGGRRGRPVRRGVLHVQRGDRLADALPARRAGRCCSSPGAEVVHVGGASHGGQLYVENLRGHPALPRQAPGRARRPSGRGGCCSGRCGCAALVFRGERGRGTATGARFLASGDVRLAARGMSEYLRLAFGTVVVLAPGAAVARALGQRSAAALARLGARGRVRRVGGRLRRPRLDPARRRSCWPRSAVAAVVVHAVRACAGCALGDRRGPGWSGSCSAGSSGTSRARSPATGCSTRRACASSSSSATCTCARSTSSRTAGSIPATRSRSGTASSRSSRRSPGVDPSVVDRATSRRCSRRSRALRRVRGGRRGVRLAGGGRLGVLAASLALFCFAAGHGGSYATLALPATASRQLLVPAAIALFFLWVARGAGRPRPRSRPCSARSRSSTRPTRSSLLLPLAGYALAPSEAVARSGVGLAAALVPIGLALLWLLPLVDETPSRTIPSAARAARARSSTTATSWSCRVARHYRLAAEVFGRSGAVAVAALVAACRSPGSPCAARWAAFVLGGTIARARADARARGSSCTLLGRRLALAVAPRRRVRPVRVRLRRAASRCSRGTWLVLPLALAAGIVLQQLWPGDFEYGLRHGGPALATWIALVRRRRGARARAGSCRRRRAVASATGLGAAAALLFVLPVLVHGFRHWSPRVTADPAGALAARSSASSARGCRQGAIVLAPLQTSYRILAAAPVYVVARRSSHVADTKANDPYGRAAARRRWLAHERPARREALRRDLGDPQRPPLSSPAVKSRECCGGTRDAAVVAGFRRVEVLLTLARPRPFAATGASRVPAISLQPAGGRRIRLLLGRPRAAQHVAARRPACPAVDVPGVRGARRGVGARRSPCPPRARGAWAFGLIAAVLVERVRFTSAPADRLAAGLEHPVAALPRAGLPLDPDIAFGFGLTLSLPVQRGDDHDDVRVGPTRHRQAFGRPARCRPGRRVAPAHAPRPAASIRPERHLADPARALHVHRAAFDRARRLRPRRSFCAEPARTWMPSLAGALLGLACARARLEQPHCRLRDPRAPRAPRSPARPGRGRRRPRLPPALILFWPKGYPRLVSAGLPCFIRSSSPMRVAPGRARCSGTRRS